MTLTVLVGCPSAGIRPCSPMHTRGPGSGRTTGGEVPSPVEGVTGAAITLACPILLRPCPTGFPTRKGPGLTSPSILPSLKRPLCAAPTHLRRVRPAPLEGNSCLNFLAGVVFLPPVDLFIVWHHPLNGQESEPTPRDGEGQGSSVCCRPWGCKESDTTERLNND